MEDVRLMDELTRALWYGLTGRTSELRRVLVKTMPRLKESQPGLADRIARLLVDSQESSGGVVREAPQAEGAPVDPDSRMDLLHVERTPEIPFEPVWAPEVGRGLRQLIGERQARERLATAGLTPCRTALFTGPPGVGKTMAARWLARQLGLPLYVLNLSTVVSSYLGRTGANIRQVFAFARSGECVLFLDELDAIAKRRDDESDVGELKRLVTVLLQEFDAWPSHNLLVAATNHANLLDRAVWRRFEMHVQFNLPTREQLAQVVPLMLRGSAELDPSLPDVVSAAFVGASFSDVEHAISRAQREALIGGEDLHAKIIELATERCRHLPQDSRQEIARALSSTGFSQRDVHRLTGLARETIRKVTDPKFIQKEGT